MVYMVDEEVAGGVDNNTVHFGMDSFSIFECGSDSVEGVCAGVCVPFVFVQPFEIFGVNDGVFAAGKRYFAEGVAVMDPSVKQHNPDYWLLYTSWNCKS